MSILKQQTSFLPPTLPPQMAGVVAMWEHNRKLWLTALRSGEYDQCMAELWTYIHNEGKDGMHYCATGVGIKITNRSIDEMLEDDRYPELNVDEEKAVIRTFCDAVGLTVEGYAEVVTLNDEKELSLEKIADVLEQEPHRFFKG